MGFIPASYGQAQLVFSIPGQGGPAMVVFGYDSTLSPNPDLEAQEIFGAWSKAGSLISIQDGQTVLTECRTLVRLGSGELQAGLFSGSASGGLSGANAPPQVAVLFQKLTGLAGRNRRGRLYMPGAKTPGEDGSYTAGEILTFQAAADVFMAQMEVDGNPMVLLHAGSVDTPNAVTELRVVGLCATQRRRLR